jgi:hypothetical protein
MSSSNSAASAANARGAFSASLRLAPALYAGTLFASALLLFAVQPMFTKMVLPYLGGAPAVWSVAMVFFQGALLAGYGYAHLLARTLTPGRAAIVHLIVLAGAAMTLPIGIVAGFGNPPSSGIELWLVALFAASIGLPFVALSASAPLLQSWFAVSGHRQAKNPYVLYAASNLGSFAALLFYPFLLEPLVSLRGQARLWSAGIAVLAVLIAVAGLFVSRVTVVPAAPAKAAPKPSTAERLGWTALAAIPSGLVIAVTAHISTDVAAAPFLWVVPLALYLLTFVALFRERPWVDHGTTILLVPFVVAALSIGVLGGDKASWLITIALNLIGFIVLAMLCHGELYRRRPAPARLTEFYLWVSFGGVLGGIFAGLLAPYLFNNTYEYPVLIAAAVLVLPGTFTQGREGFLRDAGPVLALTALVAAARVLFDAQVPESMAYPFQIGLVALAGLMVIYRQRPARLFSLVVLAFVVIGVWQPGAARIENTRSFFGVHKVVETADGRHRILFHGTTIHGAERLREANGKLATGRPEPLTYYYFGGPISEAIDAARAAQGRLRSVAAVGLGTGSLACHIKNSERWTFFEIDPEVVRLARNPKQFRFISECAPRIPVVLGDARLTLAASRDRYDLIVLDAFSSDAIPVHLLTREAFQGYLARLNPRGVTVVHISNRHMDLARVVGAVAAAEGLVAMAKFDENANQVQIDYKAKAHVAVLARTPSDLRTLAQKPGWKRIDPGQVIAWTDDYSDILGAILRKKLRR